MDYVEEYRKVLSLMETTLTFLENIEEYEGEYPALAKAIFQIRYGLIPQADLKCPGCVEDFKCPMCGKVIRCAGCRKTLELEVTNPIGGLSEAIDTIDEAVVALSIEVLYGGEDDELPSE